MPRVLAGQRLRREKPSGRCSSTAACPPPGPDFLGALWAHTEPADLRWIYLTHPDRDHTESLMEILSKRRRLHGWSQRSWAWGFCPWNTRSVLTGSSSSTLGSRSTL